MDWYGNDIHWQGSALMILGMLVFWLLVVAAAVLLVRQFGRDGRTDSSQTTPPAPEQLLAERFATGEIDGPEYGDRLTTLRKRVRT